MFEPCKTSEVRHGLCCYILREKYNHYERCLWLILAHEPNKLLIITYVAWLLTPYNILYCWDKVSLCNLGWLQTCFLAEDDLELLFLTPPECWDLQTCATKPDFLYQSKPSITELHTTSAPSPSFVFFWSRVSLSWNQLCRLDWPWTPGELPPRCWD